MPLARIEKEHCSLKDRFFEKCEVCGKRNTGLKVVGIFCGMFTSWTSKEEYFVHHNCVKPENSDASRAVYYLLDYPTS